MHLSPGSPSGALAQILRQAIPAAELPVGRPREAGACCCCYGCCLLAFFRRLLPGLTCSDGASVCRLLAQVAILAAGTLASRRGLTQDVPPFFLQIDSACYASNITKGNGCTSTDSSGQTPCQAQGAQHTLLACCPSRMEPPFSANDQLSCQSFLPPYADDFSNFFACSGTLSFSSCCCAYFLPDEIAEAG